MTDTNPNHYRYHLSYFRKDEPGVGIGSVQFETDLPVIHLDQLKEILKPTMEDKPFSIVAWQLIALRHRGEDWRPTHPLAKT